MDVTFSFQAGICINLHCSMSVSSTASDNPADIHSLGPNYYNTLESSLTPPNAWRWRLTIFILFQAPVVQMVDNGIKRIYLYPVHNAIVFPNIYSLDSDLSSGWRYNWGPGSGCKKHLEINGTRHYYFKTIGYCSRTKFKSPLILRRFYATWPKSLVIWRRASTLRDTVCHEGQMRLMHAQTIERILQIIHRLIQGSWW